MDMWEAVEQKQEEVARALAGLPSMVIIDETAEVTDEQWEKILRWHTQRHSARDIAYDFAITLDGHIIEAHPSGA